MKTNTLALVLSLAIPCFCWSTPPRLSDLILPNPFSGSGSEIEAIRPYNELIGTGIGKYDYPSFEGFPSTELKYYLIDPTSGIGDEVSAECAAAYIDMIMSFKEERNEAEDVPPVRTTIIGVDCLIYDYPNQKRMMGYLLKQYIVEFYIPEHKRVYAISFEAFWNPESKYPYNHKYTPMKVKKALKDFIAHNK